MKLDIICNFSSLIFIDAKSSILYYFEDNILAYCVNSKVKYGNNLNFRYTFKTIYHLLDMAALILTLIVIIYWIQIITHEKVIIGSDGSSVNAPLIVFEFSELRDTYLILCSINCIIRALCLVK